MKHPVYLSICQPLIYEGLWNLNINVQKWWVNILCCHLYLDFTIDKTISVFSRYHLQIPFVYFPLHDFISPNIKIDFCNWCRCKKNKIVIAYKWYRNFLDWSNELSDFHHSKVFLYFSSSAFPRRLYQHFCSRPWLNSTWTTLNHVLKHIYLAPSFYHI